MREHSGKADRERVVHGLANVKVGNAKISCNIILAVVTNKGDVEIEAFEILDFQKPNGSLRYGDHEQCLFRWW